MATLRDLTTILGYFEADDQPTATQWEDSLSSFITKLDGGLHALALGQSIDLASSSVQTIYTVPTGRTVIPLALVVRAPSATAAAGVIEAGFNAGADDWITAQSLTGLTGSTKAKLIMPDAFTLGAATNTFGVQLTTTVSGVTATADLIGLLL